LNIRYSVVQEFTYLVSYSLMYKFFKYNKLFRLSSGKYKFNKNVNFFTSIKKYMKMGTENDRDIGLKLKIYLIF